MAFLCRRRHVGVLIRAYSSSLQDSTVPSSTVLKSRNTISVLKSESSPANILEICRANTFSHKYYLDRAALSIAVSNLSKSREGYLTTFFEELLSKRPDPRDQKFNAQVIVLLGKAKLLNEAMAFFKELHLPGTRGSAKCLNALIYACILCRDFEEMKRVYSEFPKLYNVKLNVESYNWVIRGLCDSGEADSSYSILKVMEERRVNPNGATFAALLKGFCDEQNLEGVDNLLVLMKEKYRFNPRASTHNVRIKALCRQRKSAEAKALLDGLHKDVVNATSYNELIRGFCKEGNVEEAKSLVNEMKIRGFEPNCDAYYSLIDCLSQGENLEDALHFCKDSIAKGWVPKFTTMTKLVNGLKGAGKTEEAKEIIAEVKGKVSRKVELWEEIEAGMAVHN